MDLKQAACWCRGLLERLNSWQSEDSNNTAAIPVSALMDMAQGGTAMSALRSAVAQRSADAQAKA